MKEIWGTGKISQNSFFLSQFFDHIDVKQGAKQ